MWQHACDLHGLSCFAPKSRNTQDTCEITLHRVCLCNSYDVFWIYFHMQKCGCGPSEDGSPRRGCLLHGRYERLRKLNKWTVWTNKHIRRNLLFLPRSGSEPWTSGNSDIAMTTTPSAHSYGSICKSAYVSHACTLAITLSAIKRCTSVQCEYLLGSGISPIKRKSCVLFLEICNLLVVFSACGEIHTVYVLIGLGHLGKGWIVRGTTTTQTPALLGKQALLP